MSAQVGTHRQQMDNALLCHIELLMARHGVGDALDRALVLQPISELLQGRLLSAALATWPPLHHLLPDEWKSLFRPADNTPALPPDLAERLKHAETMVVLLRVMQAGV